VRPFLYAMHGVREERRKIFARASKKIPSAVGRTDFVRVKLVRTDQEYFAEPVRVSGSGILSSMTKSDGFVVIPENKEGVAEGELVAVTEYHPW
ncbi:MAG: molybdopterin molybdenumtransferase MoeA, partial [archaeon]|nr:molybdopterin molybdenumtransferase MoeA [archaeon]